MKFNVQARVDYWLEVTADTAEEAENLAYEAIKLAAIEDEFWMVDTIDAWADTTTLGLVPERETRGRYEVAGGAPA